MNRQETFTATLEQAMKNTDAYLFVRIVMLSLIRIMAIRYSQAPTTFTQQTSQLEPSFP